MPAPSARSGSAETVTHVVAGPDGHGVTRHALGLLAREALGHHRVLRLPDAGHEASPAEAVERLAAAPDGLLHLHLTDHLYAPSAPECAGIVTALARHRRIGLTLHDLPAPGDGPGRYERRRAAYARMALAAAVVVVSSRHEERLLRSALTEEGFGRAAGGQVHVIPLPLERPEPADAEQTTAISTDTPAGPRDLVVFGFLYPGKGHVPAIDALAGSPPLPADVGVTALGAVSAGHEHLPGELQARAAALGRRFTATGHVPDEEVTARLRAAAVPVAPHEHISASGSIGSWLGAGRRPLVPVGTYVDELESRCPGALFRYGPGTGYATLADAARAALDDPRLTWLAAGVELHPSPDEAAAEYARVLDAVASRTMSRR